MNFNKYKPQNVWFSTSTDISYQFSQKWSKEPGTRLWYVFYKILFCMYFLSSLAYTYYVQDVKWGGTSQNWKYIIYMTRWGINFISLALLMDTIITCLVYKNKTTNTILMSVSWVISTATYCMAILITLVYWTVLFKYEEPPSYNNLFVHLFQGIFVIVDTLISSREWHLWKIWVCFPLPLCWMVFSLVFWAAGGTDEHGNPYIYIVLDYGGDLDMALLVIFGVVVAMVVIYAGLWGLTRARDKISPGLTSVKLAGRVNKALDVEEA